MKHAGVLPSYLIILGDSLCKVVRPGSVLRRGRVRRGVALAAASGVTLQLTDDLL